MTKQKFKPGDMTDELIVEIDEKIEALERKMAPYEKYNAEKVKLLAARRALLGKSQTGGTGTKVTVDDIVSFLKDNPGASASQIAERFSVQLTTISSHLYRNKDRFIAKDKRYWARDPKNGMDTADDIEEDDE